MSASRPLKTRKLGAALSLILAAMTVATLSSTVSLVAANRGLRVEQPITASGAAASAGNPTPARDPVVVGCPTDQARLANWKAIGVRFEGHWRSEELNVVLDVLDRYADCLGEERFLELVRRSVLNGSDGVHRDLAIAMAPNAVDASAAELRWIASWAPHMGQITLYENLFDQEHVEAHYRWRFLSDLQAAQPAPVTVQMFAVAHEVGHLLLDGLRQEHVASGRAPFVLEELYAESLLVDYWAEPFEVPNESLADETALWVFGIRRPAVVRAHLEGTLIPALRGLQGWNAGDSSLITVTPAIAPGS
jgi:hypothetical protein